MGWHSRVLARVHRGEEGSSLVMALAFLALFGTFVAITLSFAETSFRATLAIREQGSAHYAADAALDGAINRLRSDLDAGREGDDFTCFNAPATNGVVASVRCEGQDGSGESSGGTTNADNKPPLALLSLATLASGDDGIVEGHNGALKVHGDVFSNSTIRVTQPQGQMAVEGSVTARGACDAAAITTTTPPLACTYGSGSNALGDDPGYAPRVSSAPAYKPVPSCGSGWLVTFEPGTYNDAVALTALFDGGCGGKVFWFRPGTYYFDFVTPGVSHVWGISDSNANVVGGTPMGWSTGAGSRPAIPVPGGCDPAASGVQLIFGGDSRWSISDGDVELCAEPSETSQQIAVYGLRSGSLSSSSVTRVPTTATSTSYLLPINATAIDGLEATAAILSSSPGGSATITLSGFSGIPAGSTITAATLSVAHRDTNTATSTSTTNVASVQATVTPASGSATTTAVPLRGTPGTDTIDLLAAGMSPTVDATGFSVQYRATAKNSRAVTSRLDGITLSLTYTAPAFEAQRGCLTVRPYGSAGSCAMLRTSGPSTDVYVHGTTYAPRSVIDLVLMHASQQPFDRGIIAWSIRLAISPSNGYAGPLVQTPDDAGGIRADRVVLLTASVGPTDRIRALVTIEDEGGATPGDTVTVESWSVLR